MKSVAVYLPGGERLCAIRGGALATWTREVYKRIAGRWDITVFAPGFDGSHNEFCCSRIATPHVAETLYNIIRDRELKGLLNPIKTWLRTAYARRAASAIASLRPDVIHVHNDPEAVVPIRRRNPRATIVLHMNNDHLIEGDRSVSASEAIQAVDWVAFCSHYVMEGALANVKGLRRDRCFVIHNGADLPAESSPPTGKFKSESGPLILFVGRIVEQKGLHVLLDAMPQVLEHFPTASLRIVGGVRFGSHEVDPYLARLRTQATPLGDRVKFVGPIAHTEIGNQFQQSDIFVCPSLWNEPLGMVNLEAMGAGVPVIAFARGGIPEAVGDAGLLVEETAPAPLAAALIRLLNDPDLRRQCAQKDRKRVAEHFTWDNIARQWRERLEQWMGRS
jgi:spore coat protein SA